MFQSSFRLRQHGLVGPRIDIDQRIALVHHLAFVIVNRHHLAGDLAVDRDRIDRRHRAQGVDINIDVAGFGLAGRDRRRACCPRAPAAPDVLAVSLLK